MHAKDWSLINLGLFTQSLVERFLQRLTAALYYNRNNSSYQVNQI